MGARKATIGDMAASKKLYHKAATKRTISTCPEAASDVTATATATSIAVQAPRPI